MPFDAPCHEDSQSLRQRPLGRSLCDTTLRNFQVTHLDRNVVSQSGKEANAKNCPNDDGDEPATFPIWWTLMLSVLALIKRLESSTITFSTLGIPTGGSGINC
jgi:hypothetical protein